MRQFSRCNLEQAWRLGFIWAPQTDLYLENVKTHRFLEVVATTPMHSTVNLEIAQEWSLIPQASDVYINSAIFDARLSLAFFHLGPLIALHLLQDTQSGSWLMTTPGDTSRPTHINDARDFQP